MIRQVETLHKSTDQQFGREVLEAEAQAILDVIPLLDEGFDAAIELICSCRGNVIVAGIGKSGLVGQKISATLASTGTASHFLHPVEALHGDLGRIRAGDVVITLSYSGETEDIVSLASIIRADDVKLVSIVGARESRLARLSNAVIAVGNIKEACPYNLAPTASTTAMLALGDTLALTVSRRRKFSAADFHKRHPGGRLGRATTPITEILRFKVGKNLTLVPEGYTVGEVLKASSSMQRRAGAVLLINEDCELSGIFTDSDLRRLLTRDGATALDRPIRDVMTQSPACLRDTDLVCDAVQLIRERRLDEIPVVTSNGAPVGLVDVQDLLAMKVIEEL